MEYKEQLKDPRWQRKRLEIMSRDNFTCQECGSTDKPLVVHHKTYKHCKKGEPWTCPDDDLITLCEDCHKDIHNPNMTTSEERCAPIRQSVRDIYNKEVSTLVLEGDTLILEVGTDNGPDNLTRSYFCLKNIDPDIDLEEDAHHIVIGEWQRFELIAMLKEAAEILMNYHIPNGGRFNKIQLKEIFKSAREKGIITPDIPCNSKDGQEVYAIM